MPAKLKQKSLEPNSDVILADTLLKFHDKDTRRSIRDHWLFLIN